MSSKKFRILALTAKNGATIDPLAPQKLTLGVSNPFDETDASEEETQLVFMSVADFTFNPKGVTIEELIPSVTVRKSLVEAPPEIEKMLRIRIVEAIKYTLTEMSLLFNSLEPGTGPSLTEYIEFCMENKAALACSECIMSPNKDDIGETKAYSNIPRLKPNAVESYYQSKQQPEGLN